MKVSQEVDGTGAPGLTTGEVARRLGVAPTTIRSWHHRYGLGPDTHAGGRHRRWTEVDVARLERMCVLTGRGVPAAEAARLARVTTAPVAGDARRTSRPPSRSRSEVPQAGGPPIAEARRDSRAVARAALRLDAAALDELLESAIDRHGLVEAWGEVISPTLRAVGRKWERSGERYVEVEHFLSWHVSGALRRRTPAAVADRSAAALLACVPGENHTLPLEALAAALAEHGVPVRMFGAAVPVESLTAAVRRTGPAVVALWAQSRATASRPLADHVATMEWGVRGARRRPMVMTLGPGWSGRTSAGLLRPPGLAEAVAEVRAIVAC
ncbi:MerR family transcriptional regulator [Streptomyces sp. WMMC905]|uniref:MerR family transcriptional regulator n=1 Tax=Streptomyces sp. WMMC905 TaxID=3404123 RepID=UPI003B935D04